jgi:hypothetical protein
LKSLEVGLEDGILTQNGLVVGRLFVFDDSWDETLRAVGTEDGVEDVAGVCDVEVFLTIERG